MVGYKLFTFYSKNSRRRVIASSRGWMSVYCRLLVIFLLPPPPPPQCHTGECRRATWPRIGSWTFLAALQCTYIWPPYHPIIIIKWFIGSFFFFEFSSYTLASVLFLVGPWLSTCQDWKKIWKKERSYWFFNRCCLLWSIFMSTTSFTGTSLIQFWIHVLFLCTCCMPVSFFYEHVTSEGDYTL